MATDSPTPQDDEPSAEDIIQPDDDRVIDLAGLEPPTRVNTIDLHNAIRERVDIPVGAQTLTMDELNRVHEAIMGNRYFDEDLDRTERPYKKYVRGAVLSAAFEAHDAERAGPYDGAFDKPQLALVLSAMEKGTDDADGDVWVAVSRGNTRKYYHTDEDCPRLAKATDKKSVERSALFDDMEECPNCAGEVEQQQNPTYSAYKSAVRADPDDHE